MSHVALCVDVGAADGDLWSDALLAAGALSVDAVDARAGTVDETAVFDERVGGDPQFWPISRLTALLAADVDPATVIADAARAIDRDVPAYRTAPLPEQDWVSATQAQFHPIRIEDDLWIVPTWCVPPHADAVNVTLDPGLAFGTGSHPSTRLCLSWLRRHDVAGCSLLDYGCGSGILAITAARLGARRVVGVDIDPQAIAASIANARLNDIDAAFMAVDALPDGAFDIVVANILANPLRLLAPALASRTATDGRIALSGILRDQMADLIEAYAQWFALHPWQTADDWVLLTGRRRPEP